MQSALAAGTIVKTSTNHVAVDDNVVVQELLLLSSTTTFRRESTELSAGLRGVAGSEAAPGCRVSGLLHRLTLTGPGVSSGVPPGQEPKVEVATNALLPPPPPLAALYSRPLVNH